MNAEELYRAGQLTDALSALNEEVRSHPTDIERRSFLGEMLCIAGNLDRADAQMETIQNMQPSAAPMLGLVRQLIRAEKTRQEVHRQGRAPEFLAAAPAHVELRIQASVAQREGNIAEAGRLTNEAEEARPEVAGRCDGEAFDDFRDLDDACGGVFEVLTSTGRYLWIPTEDVVSIVFDEVSQPLDLLWRPAEMDIRGGPDGKVFLPTVYGFETDQADDVSRLARRTDWVTDGGEGVVRGIGTRTYLVGEDTKTVLEISEIEFGAASA